MKVSPKFPEIIMPSDMQPGDVVTPYSSLNHSRICSSHSGRKCDCVGIDLIVEPYERSSAFDASVVKQVSDTRVTLFRPYGATPNFIYNDPPGVITYIGAETQDISRNDARQQWTRWQSLTLIDRSRERVLLADIERAAEAVLRLDSWDSAFASLRLIQSHVGELRRAIGADREGLQTAPADDPQLADRLSGASSILHGLVDNLINDVRRKCRGSGVPYDTTTRTFGGGAGPLLTLCSVCLHMIPIEEGDRDLRTVPDHDRQ